MERKLLNVCLEISPAPVLKMLCSVSEQCLAWFAFMFEYSRVLFSKRDQLYERKTNSPCYDSSLGFSLPYPLTTFYPGSRLIYVYINYGELVSDQYSLRPRSNVELNSNLGPSKRVKLDLRVECRTNSNLDRPACFIHRRQTQLNLIRSI